MPRIMTKPRSVLYRGNRDDLNELCREKDNRIAQLETALRWYGEQAEGCRKLGSAGDGARQELDRDGGSKAREALAQS